VPLSKGSIVTVVLFAFLTSWTAFVAPLIFITKETSTRSRSGSSSTRASTSRLQLPDGGVGRVLPAGSRGVRARPALLRAGHLPDRTRDRTGTMDATERHELIVEQLSARGEVTVAEVSRRAGVSP